MIVQSIPHQPYRVHLHAHRPTRLTVMPAHARIQRLGLCGVQS